MQGDKVWGTREAEKAKIKIEEKRFKRWETVITVYTLEIVVC